MATSARLPRRPLARRKVGRPAADAYPQVLCIVRPEIADLLDIVLTKLSRKLKGRRAAEVRGEILETYVAEKIPVHFAGMTAAEVVALRREGAGIRTLERISNRRARTEALDLPRALYRAIQGEGGDQ